MEIKKRLIGNIDKQIPKLIYKDLLNGILVKDICRNYGINFSEFSEIYNKFIKCKIVYQPRFYIYPKGYYYTEKELIDGIPKYNWNNLSRNEKLFYTSYMEKENKEKPDIIDMIALWSNVFGLPVKTEPKFPSHERTILATSLIVEELGELATAIREENFTESQDALGDLLWVTVRMMMEFGIDPHKTIEAIFHSNMSKADVDEQGAIYTKATYMRQNIETYYKKLDNGMFITYRKSDDKVAKSYKFEPPKF